MSRNVTLHALTLRVKSSGESNREAWFLTAEEGVVKATVFGGPKSRLRSQVAPFHEGSLIIYRDPVKDFRKVSDFDVEAWRPGLREVWERAMTADAVAETILASHGGGGEWRAALELAGAVLDALSGAEAGACPRLKVYFFWHWAQFLGVKPELSACAFCGRETGREDTLRYSVKAGALFCETCAKNSGAGYPAAGPGDSVARPRLDPEARLLLERIETLHPAALEQMPADALPLEQAAALSQAGTLSQAVLAAALGKKLPTWDEV